MGEKWSRNEWITSRLYLKLKTWLLTRTSSTDSPASAAMRSRVARSGFLLILVKLYSKISTWSSLIVFSVDIFTLYTFGIQQRARKACQHKELDSVQKLLFAWLLWFNHNIFTKSSFCILNTQSSHYHFFAAQCWDLLATKNQFDVVIKVLGHKPGDVSSSPTLYTKPTGWS